MTNPTLERAEKALRDEVDRQVEYQYAYSGPQNGKPDYVDAELDYPALCRAVLMAVRDYGLERWSETDDVNEQSNNLLVCETLTKILAAGEFSARLVIHDHLRKEPTPTPTADDLTHRP